MPAIKLRLNGLLSRGRDNSCIVFFEEPEIKLEMLLTILKAEVPGKAIAFVAVNGTKVTEDSLIHDGDNVDIFPVVAGG
jgi:molybdopterin converting factor small subunit